MTTSERDARETGVIPVWTVADRLRKARLHARLEQPELAAKVGIARASVSNYERGVTEPGRPVLYTWAAVTGVDFAWLAGDLVAGNLSGLPRLDSNQQPAELRCELHQWDYTDEPVIDAPVTVEEFRALLLDQNVTE